MDIICRLRHLGPMSRETEIAIVRFEDLKDLIDDEKYEPC